MKSVHSVRSQLTSAHEVAVQSRHVIIPNVLSGYLLDSRMTGLPGHLERLHAVASADFVTNIIVRACSRP